MHIFMVNSFVGYFLSGLMTGTSFGMLLAKNPVHSILYLILSFAWLAVLLLNLGIDFLAMLVMIVYIGAIAVLFLFVVMYWIFV